MVVAYHHRSVGRTATQHWLRLSHRDNPVESEILVGTQTAQKLAGLVGLHVDYGHHPHRVHLG